MPKYRQRPYEVSSEDDDWAATGSGMDMDSTIRIPVASKSRRDFSFGEGRISGPRRNSRDGESAHSQGSMGGEDDSAVQCDSTETMGSSGSVEMGRFDYSARKVSISHKNHSKTGC